MKMFLMIIMFIAGINICSADQLIIVPQVAQPSSKIIVVEPPTVITPKPLVRTIEWVLTPQVNNIVVPEIRTGLFGRQYIVNRNELVTTWVYVPVEVWK